MLELILPVVSIVMISSLMVAFTVFKKRVLVLLEIQKGIVEQISAELLLEYKRFFEAMQAMEENYSRTIGEMHKATAQQQMAPVSTLEGFCRELNQLGKESTAAMRIHDQTVETLKISIGEMRNEMRLEFSALFHVRKVKNNPVVTSENGSVLHVRERFGSPHKRLKQRKHSGPVGGAAARKSRSPTAPPTDRRLKAIPKKRK